VGREDSRSGGLGVEGVFGGVGGEGVRLMDGSVGKRGVRQQRLRKVMT